MDYISFYFSPIQLATVPLMWFDSHQQVASGSVNINIIDNSTLWFNLSYVVFRATARFLRLPPASGGTAQTKILHLANWRQLIHP